MRTKKAREYLSYLQEEVNPSIIKTKIIWIDSSEFKDQDWNFKEIHEKLLKDWLKLVVKIVFC